MAPFFRGIPGCLRKVFMLSQTNVFSLCAEKILLPRSIQSSLAVASLVATAYLVPAMRVDGAAKTWNNTGTDYNTTGNWTGGTPGPADVGTFTSIEVTQPNLSASLSNAGIYFKGTGSSGYDITRTNSAAFTLTGTDSTGGSGTTNSTAAPIRSEITSGTNEVDAPVILGAASGTQVFFQASGGTLIVNQVVSNTNTINLSFKGGGTLQLNGTNSFSTGSIGASSRR